MIIGRVYGSVVSTHKLEALVGYKFMLVQCIEHGQLVDKYLVAVDTIGAGMGEDVIITRGSGARMALGKPDAPVDAAIVGILDEKQC
ncbi:MAG: EutN/CcmL family microcompartment protein [Clostridia bacterium]|nr:EutN/CcmL family microcompartment protein [Clostridia bacterium]MBQ2670167.1 EutN/CcmL family microcompartment protein [Clostridia bacterium]MBQ3471801.1 EutN/CcmL family microcompartment protein [Clostridia bacterium]MBQ6559182.1 EutN/CcmL family microcompartment protein [Clostridia bacterium]MBR0028176.1 EutN/CcmL family microcompartment protein [Clostridia bacterium]